MTRRDKFLLYVAASAIVLIAALSIAAAALR